MVATESNPYIKVGGLGDVVFGLSKSYVKDGLDVSIIMPFYEKLKHDPSFNYTLAVTLDVSMGWRNFKTNIYQTTYKGVQFYFVDNAQYFIRGGVYGYSDDGERWAFFVHAVRQFVHHLDTKPSIIHVHDYHPGMLATVMKQKDQYQPWFSSIKFVFTLHSPAFQGELDRSKLDDFYQLHTDLFDYGHLRLKDKVSTLKAAIIDSDFVTTVSPTHAKELLTSEGGFGLDGVFNLRSDAFEGILNGVDEDEWNPFNDSMLPIQFLEDKFFESKAQNKALLYQSLGWEDKNRPLFGVVSRLTFQKGISLVIDHIENLIQRGGNVIILGAGEWNLEQHLKHLEHMYPQHLKVELGYNNPLAHRIYASSDYFFMPSLFEPCGISQMIALRFGTLPIVRATGGLKDTVIGHHKGIDKATGIVFKHYNHEALGWVIDQAFYIYQDKAIFNQLRKNAMSEKNSWTTAAKKYKNLYKKLQQS